MINILMLLEDEDAVVVVWEVFSSVVEGGFAVHGLAKGWLREWWWSWGAWDRLERCLVVEAEGVKALSRGFN